MARTLRVKPYHINCIVSFTKKELVPGVDGADDSG